MLQKSRRNADASAHADDHVRLQHLDQHANDGARRVELAARLAFRPSKAAEEKGPNYSKMLSQCPFRLDYGESGYPILEEFAEFKSQPYDLSS